jgi:uncharacterized repeat protein (TIGR02543 family)
MKKIVAGIIILFCVVSAGFVWAQTATQQESEYTNNQSNPIKEQEEFLENIRRDIENGTVKPEELPPPLLQLVYSESAQLNGQESTISQGAVSCFDYYTFNSITADITSSTNDAVSGTSMDFYGTLTNKNPYPIVEGTLYVKVFKSTGPEKNPNGPDVVDQFIAVDNINIPANGSVPVSFTWQVPAYAVSGDYRLATFFTSDKKFNLLGLSFTDDIVGNEYLFTISGEQDEYIMFDKSSVVINDNPYYFAAYPPRIEPEKPANVSVSVLNNTDEYRDVNVLWKLYKWDAMHPDNFVREFSSVASIQANSASEISVSIDDADAPVYLLIGEIQERDTKSIVNIRYVRGDIDKVRLNFPAVTKFPLQEGEDTTVFTCLHNAGQSHQVLNNKVVLEVKNAKGKVIESHIYEGPITGEMMAIKKDFKPKKSLDKFSVYSAIYTNGVLVDESTMEYDCALIDPRTCQEKDTHIIWIALSIIGLIGLLVIFQKMKNKKSLLVLFMFVIGFAVLNPIKTDAFSIRGQFSKEIGDVCGNAMTDYNIGGSIIRTLNLTRGNGNTISQSNFQLGINGTVDFDLEEITGGNWSVTDTIIWRSSAQTTAGPFTYNETFQEVFYNTNFIPRAGYDDVHRKRKIYSPQDNGIKSITSSDNSILSCTGTTCTALSPGNATIRVEIHNGNVSTKEWRSCGGNTTTTNEEKINYTYPIYEYTVTVPQPANRPPNPPTITGPVSGNTGTQYSFTFQASDPDGDQIQYGIDWDNNNSIDTWTPSGTNWVNSNTERSASKTWSGIGIKNFKAIAKDRNGSTSGWGLYTIVLSESPVNGSCSTTLNTCTSGIFSDRTDSATQHLWSCNGSNGGTNASCSLNRQTYTITYNPNGATSGTAPASQTKTHGVNLTLATNSGNLFKTRYTFSGWNTNAAGTGTNYTAGATYTANSSATLFAKWNPIPPPTNETATCSADGTRLTISWTPPTGYNSINFRVSPSSSWTTSGWGDTTLWAPNVTGTTRTVTVTPGTQYNWWVETHAGSSNYSSAVGGVITCTNTNRYTITFNGNGADGGSMSPMTNLVPGSSPTLPAYGFTRTGYTFTGWATSAGANASYADRAQYPNITGNVTLFAKWSQIPVSSYPLSVTKSGLGSGTITSNPSGISCGTDCIENYSNNTSVTLTASAAQGSTFTGWSGACTGDTPTCTVLMNQARTVNANFNPVSPPPPPISGGIDATGTFYFRPNIADNDNICPLTIDVQNIKSCTLTKLGANTPSTYTPSAGSISLFETELKPVGTYKLTCVGTNDTPKIIGTKSCYDNGDVRED